MPSPLGIDAPPQNAVPDISQFISVAQQQIAGTGSGASDVTDAITNQGKVAQESAAATAASLEGRQALLTKTYGDLSKEFEVQQAHETDTAKGIGDARIGEAKVALARSGVTDAQGGFRAPVTGAENDLESTIGQIADKYSVKQEEAADAFASNIQQLSEQIVQAKNSGNEAWAATLTSVAQLKYQQNQQVLSLAQQMQAAQSQAEKDAWQQYMDVVNMQHQQETLDLAYHASAREDASAARAAAADVDHSGIYSNFKLKPSQSGPSNAGLTFTDKSGKTIPAAEYAKQSGKSVIDVLSGSNDPGDREFIAKYKELQQQIADSTDPDTTAKQANALISRDFSHIVGQNKLF